MSLMAWLKMNLIMDISFFVFFAFLLYKANKLNKRIDSLQEELDLTIKTPHVARRRLKKRENSV